MARKNKNDIGTTMALIGGAIAVLVVMRYPAILGILLVAAALWWWTKRKPDPPLVWNVDPEDPPEQPKDEYDWPRIRREIERVFDMHSDLFLCLVFIARADGQMRDKERYVLIDLFLDLAEHKAIPRWKLDNEIKDLRTLKNEEFEASLKRIVAKGEGEMRLLAGGAEQIIGTQKAVSPGEAYCAEAINRLFAKGKEG